MNLLSTNIYLNCIRDLTITYVLFSYICSECIKAIHRFSRISLHLLVYTGGWFFYGQELTARCFGTPYPALNGAGRLDESRYAKTVTSRFGNRLNENSSMIMAVLVMTLPQGDEVKQAYFILDGNFKIKDRPLSSIFGGRGASLPTVCLRTG